MPQPISPTTATPDIFDTGASVVISHKVSHANTPAYENWLTQIRDKVMHAQGFLDSHIIRPIAGLTETYTVLIRFDTVENLNAWMHSDTRNQLISEVTPILIGNDDFQINSGLEFLFPSPLANAPKPPKRWKQFLLTWSAIFPLVSIISGLVGWLLATLQLDLPRLVVIFFMTVIVVFCMVYIVMPRYTKLVKNWLNS